MCGIHGIVSFEPGCPPDPRVHSLMGDVSIHRGPDDHGHVAHGNAIIGMRRLSIIDVEGGHQPIANEDQSLWVVCNGEIYNFRELRSDLVARGHVFTTNSDTEVIVHLYEEFGDDLLEHLDGMFGLALLDCSRNRVLIGRDRLGIKPLYYYQDSKRLIFASEAKSILQVPEVRAELDETSLGHYLTLGYVPAPHSMFRGIRKLPPGSMAICEDSLQIVNYWSPTQEASDFIPEGEVIKRLADQLDQSISSQMVSDVPLGAFLSGGIDSSCVVAYMARHSDRPVKTYSIGFSDSSGGGYYNELPYARRVAEIFKTDHHEIIVEPEVASLLPRLLWHMDEPIADAAFITTFLVSEFASRDVKVILSGVGGDELFGGYRRYLGEYYGKYYNWLPNWVRSGVVAPVARLLPSDRHSRLMNYSRLARSFLLSSSLSFEDRYREYLSVFSRSQRDEILRSNFDSPDSLDAALLATKGQNPIARQMQVDVMTQLPDDLLMLTDKMSMANSLECRVPLLDQNLVSLAARIPSHQKVRGRDLKHVLKKALTGVLPNDILYRSKRGFGAPFGAWIKNELAPLMYSVLSRETIEKRGLLNWSSVQQTIENHVTNKADNTDHLLSLINLELWMRIYIDGEDHESISAELQDSSQRTHA